MMFNKRIFADKDWENLDKQIIGNTLVFRTSQGVNLAEVVITKATSYGPEGEDERAYKGNKALGQKTEPGTIDLKNMMGNWVLLISTGSADTAACIKIDEVQYNGKKMRTGAFLRDVYKIDASKAKKAQGTSVILENNPITFK